MDVYVFPSTTTVIAECPPLAIFGFLICFLGTTSKASSRDQPNRSRDSIFLLLTLKWRQASFFELKTKFPRENSKGFERFVISSASSTLQPIRLRESNNLLSIPKWRHAEVIDWNSRPSTFSLFPICSGLDCSSILQACSMVQVPDCIRLCIVISGTP